MTHLIDKDALVAEIERKKNLCEKIVLDLRTKENIDYYQGKAEAYKETIDLLDTLEVKEVDLDSSRWIPFVPSNDLPRDRVTIAYKTNDERGIRYAYGYFQFYNGTCSMFWKDGNERPIAVKNKDIVCWMPIKEVKAQKGGQ